MFRILTLVPIALICASCTETTGRNDSFESGIGRDTADSLVSGTIRQGGSGRYTFVLNRAGTVCTANFESPAQAGKSDLARLYCAGGGNGTATVVYGGNARPERVVYAVIGSGGGTITF